MHELDVETVAPGADDFLRLAHPQQAAVDEDAGELVADRLMDHCRGHRTVHAAGQAADHPALPHLRADAGDAGLAEPGHAPAAGEPGDAVGEVLQQLPAVRGVDDLRVELDAVVAAGVVGDRGERGALAAGDDAEAGRQPGHAVAVVHPDRLARAWRPGAMEQLAILDHLGVGLAVFLVVAEADLAAELRAHGLLAVADAEHGQAGGEDGVGDAGRFGVGDAGRAAGEDDRARARRPRCGPGRRWRAGSRSRCRIRGPGGRSTG